jgi:glycosyltransferase involved in cell wall biosynthesis
MHAIQVVEPTLEGYSGHCHALVSNFIHAAAAFPVDLWSGRGSADMTFGPQVTVHPLFRRRVRLLQMVLLLRRLLRGSGKILLTTARRSDLLLVDLVARGSVPPDKVFLYFHWFRPTTRKLSFLRKMAARQPATVILGTTESVVDVFRRCGFANVMLLPYPAPPFPGGGADAVPFRRLLYAGAARQDKGFRIVVDLVELLASRNEQFPIAIQISADHYGKYDAATRADIARLEATRYPALTLIRETPSPEEYAANFPGSICLQPYVRDEFRDRVSGVTLDALAHGCPIIATAGTWSAARIEPFGAGIALARPDAGSLYAAAAALRADYARYQSLAMAAARATGGDSWAPLLERLRA